MLLVLLSGFALSQAYRTVTAMIAAALQSDFGLSPSSLGLFASLFALTFGAVQLFMGVGIDLYGLRRTVLMTAPLSILGAALSAWSPGYGWLLAGQALIGLGCAPAFLACTVFIARHFPAAQFAAVSGIGMGLGGIGMLFTGSPLAWLVEQHGWRAAFAALGLLSLLSWLLIAWKVHEPVQSARPGPRQSPLAATREFGALLAQPHSWGILAMGLVTYASFLTLRGLWLGPLLMERHGWTLVASGHLALTVSLISLVSPGLFGRMDPGPLRRRRLLVGAVSAVALMFAALGLLHAAWLNVALIILIVIVSGCSILQYAHVRSSYPPEATGRAMALLTMAMFLGAALMQWLTGVFAAVAVRYGVDPFGAVMVGIAGMLCLGAAAFQTLPQSESLKQG
ncbi:MFS transporter [Acidovorax sp. D4N7]|uniref:MFS transporter n=3 Tax=Comamonas endophytica TaxID=2949090 RepID=A0ABY6GF74_9BURK|nr:MFS transporter [Acidovorax sp. D4N7]MCD2511545.1 MFS transporter [Acidovorax sp. D4N7]UYG53325.1 MFS transporter [Acidovorax sp. 5MLIR]